MGAKRAFYIVQGGLRVCEISAGEFEESHGFADNDEGLREFERYLEATALRQSVIVVDVIEEMFSPDTIPRLGSRDQKALLERRAQRKFPRTPYRLPVPDRMRRGDVRDVVLSAISNPELLDPWIGILLKHQTPLTGIYSVPLMAPELLSAIYRSSDSVLFITQHQGTRLRQVFVRNGLVKSARLSQAPALDDADYTTAVVNEIQRSRRYLERTRLLSPMEQLDVCMLVDRGLSHSLASSAESDSPMEFHFVEPDIAAKKLHVPRNVEPDRLEGLYICRALRNRPRHSYARSGENRFWQMSRMRRGLIAASGAAAACLSVVAGSWFGDALRLQQSSAYVDAQVSQLSETFRRENEDFGPIRADSYSMKLAVDTGNFILDQRVPVPWVMQQLGTVLGDHDNLRLQELRWQADSATASAPVRPRPGEPPPPVPIPEVTSVTVNLSGTLEPFDGDMRRAFAHIDRLADDLVARTAFSDAVVVEYPLDANIRSSVTGEINRNQLQAEARFQIRLVYRLTDELVVGVANGSF